jgi:hypothetical protein
MSNQSHPDHQTPAQIEAGFNDLVDASQQLDDAAPPEAKDATGELVTTANAYRAVGQQTNFDEDALNNALLAPGSTIIDDLTAALGATSTAAEAAGCAALTQ